MFDFFKRRRRQRLRSAPFPPAWLRIIEKNVPYYTLLPDADREELQGLVQIFLAEKSFEGCGGLELTDEIKLTIAAQACLLLLHRETDIYPRLITILVYPSAYVAKAVRSIGTHIGGHLVLEGEVHPLGESSSSGVVVLSWDDVKAGASDFDDGQNLVLHEFAHQLDGEDGALNGTAFGAAWPVRRLGSKYLTTSTSGSNEIAAWGAPACWISTEHPTPPSSSPWRQSAFSRSRRYSGNDTLSSMRS